MDVSHEVKQDYLVRLGQLALTLPEGLTNFKKMRRVISICMLTIFVVTMFRPILPHLDYAINFQYIKTVLCENKDRPALRCDGKCYLRKQLKAAKDSGQHSSETTFSGRLQLKEFPSYLVVAFFETEDQSAKKNGWPVLSEILQTSFYPEVMLPPPKNA